MASEAHEADGVCLGCGRAMALRAGLMVCSSACYQRELRRRRRARRRQICAGCGAEFVPGRRDAVFCSNACKQRAYRVRKAAARKRADLIASLIG
jgi:predicted nucleic acid-binding Zn ribbon protein